MNDLDDLVEFLEQRRRFTWPFRQRLTRAVAEGMLFNKQFSGLGDSEVRRRTHRRVRDTSGDWSWLITLAIQILWPLFLEWWNNRSPEGHA